MSVELALGIVGTITGPSALTINSLRFARERPIVKVSDALVSFQKQKNGEVKTELSFNVDNTGDRSTVITRVNAIFGPDVEVVEGSRTLPAHSSIRYPEKADDQIQFQFPETTKFASGEVQKYFEKEEKLTIVVVHTHGAKKKEYSIPESSRWEEMALWKGGPIVLMP